MSIRRPLLERLEGRRLFAATYYVDPSALVNGNGSEFSPWNNLDSVNDATFASESTIVLAAGKTIAGTLSLGADDVGPVTVTSDPANRATLRAADGDGISVLNAAGVTVSNLVVVGKPSAAVGGGSAQPAASFNGIEFENTLGSDGSSVRLSGVTVDNVEVYGFGRYGISVGGSGAAAKSGFAGVSITNAKVHDNTLGGIETHGNFSGTATAYANADVTVAYCVVYNNTGYANSPNHSGDGIVLSDVDGVTIEYNEAYANGAKNTHVGGPVGIWVWDVNDALLQYNESHHNRTNSTADGGGFDFDGGVTNSVMQYNYSHDNDGAGYGIYQFGGARPFYNNHVRHNLSIDDGRKNSYGAIDFWNGNGTSGIVDTYVYNNTVYVSPSVKTEPVTTTNKKGQTTTTTVTTQVGDPRALRFISGTVNVHLYNNIFKTTGGVPLAQIDARQTNLRMNGNDWHASTSFSIKVFAKVYTTFGAYQSATGYDANGLNVDPGLKVPSVNPIVGVNNWASRGTVLSGFKTTNKALAGKAVAQPWSYAPTAPGYTSIPIATKDFFGTDLVSPGDIGATEFA
jgi:hypothetical protein